MLLIYFSELNIVPYILIVCLLPGRLPARRIPLTDVGHLGSEGVGLSRGRQVQAVGPKFLQNQVSPFVGAVVHMIQR